MDITKWYTRGKIVVDGNSKDIQDVLWKLGYRWGSQRYAWCNQIRYEETSRLYLFFDDTGIIHWADSINVFNDVLRDYKEFTLEELKELELKSKDNSHEN